MRCAIVAIGDEIVTGSITDTNSPWISDRLEAIGLETSLHLAVEDDLEKITDAFRLAAERADAVIVTGGLGPTEDDLTRDAFCRFAGTDTVERPEAVDRIKAMFASIGRDMPDNNLKQARIPRGADMIQNPVGTAPGFSMETGGVKFFVLPGVPRELHAMMGNTVLPALASAAGGRVTRTLVFRTFGMTESGLDQDLAGAPLPPGVRLSFRAVFPEIHLKLTARADSEDKAQKALWAAADEVRARVGRAVYSEDGRSLEEVVLEAMRERGLKLAVAESCTGGLVTKKLTDVPGSSDVLDRGFVTYSNRAKMDMLGVQKDILKEHGAVSEQTARAMAEGALERSAGQLAIAITGVAGPAGGTKEKPAGTVYVALADKNGTWARRFNFLRADRSYVRELTATAALETIRRKVLGLPELER